MILQIQQGLLEDGLKVSIEKLCRCCFFKIMDKFFMIAMLIFQQYRMQALRIYLIIG